MTNSLYIIAHLKERRVFVTKNSTTVNPVVYAGSFDLMKKIRGKYAPDLYVLLSESSEVAKLIKDNNCSLKEIKSLKDVECLH